MPLHPAIARYDHVLLDLDGCVWVGDDALDGAADAVAALREAGKGIAFVTNDVRHAPDQFVRKLWRLGFQASLDEVVSCGAAVQFVLAERARRRRGVRDRLAGARRPRRRGGAADRQQHGVRHPRRRRRRRHARGFDYRELRIATQAVLRGAELIGTTRDRTFPMPDGPWPASGAVLAAVEEATGQRAERTIGKPEPHLYDAARDRLGAGRYLAVGDRLDTDVAGARRAGIDSALVLTGATSRAEAAAADPRPTHVADSLAALVLR